MPRKSRGRPRSSRHRSRRGLAEPRDDPGPTRRGCRDPLKLQSCPVPSRQFHYSRMMNLGGWTARRHLWPVLRNREGVMAEAGMPSLVLADRASRDASVTLGLTLPGDTVLYLLLPLHAAVFGVTLPEAGLLLAANRLVRIARYGWGAPGTAFRWAPAGSG